MTSRKEWTTVLPKLDSEDNSIDSLVFPKIVKTKYPECQ